MDNMIGRKFMISGMSIEILSDEGDSWGCRNITTGEPVLFKKTVLQKAIKLAKAEMIPESEDNQ